jgi:hypothetical protein
MRQKTGTLVVIVSIATFLMACSDDKSTTPTPPAAVVPSDSLQGVYAFTSDASDGSGAGNHGTLLGTATAGDSLILNNNAIDGLALPHGVLNGLGDFTISAWMRVLVVHPMANMLISGATAANANAFGIWYWNTHDSWTMTIDSDNYRYPADATIMDQAWHHLAFVRKGDSSSLYVDGVAIGGPIPVPATALAADSGGVIVGQDQDVVGGGFEAIQCFAGNLDNLRIYRRALTAAEVVLLRDEPR